jgi:hypothetical protein
MQVFFIFYVLGLDICVVAIESIFWFECDVPFKIFLYCLCGDNDGYRHQHWNTRHPSSSFKHKIRNSVNSQLMKMIT